MANTVFTNHACLVFFSQGLDVRILVQVLVDLLLGFGNKLLTRTIDHDMLPVLVQPTLLLSSTAAAGVLVLARVAVAAALTAIGGRCLLRASIAIAQNLQVNSATQVTPARRSPVKNFLTLDALGSVLAAFFIPVCHRLGGAMISGIALFGLPAKGIIDEVGEWGHCV